MATRRAARSSRRIGRAICWATTAPAARPSSSTTPASAARSRIEVRTALFTAATLWVTRTAPSARPWLSTGAAVARISAAEGLAVAGDLLAVAAQRGPDLRPVGVAAPGRRAGGVGEQATAAVDDDHPAADAGGGDVDEAPQARALGGVEQLRRGRRDHVGLAARLAAHLGVDPVAQAHRQRHAERDQRQQQHVGQRQQEGGPEAYGSSTSGAAKRKPTPRTVSM